MIPPPILHAILWLIFALVYVGMSLGRLPGLSLDRTGIAILGAFAMIGVGGISLADAARSIDYATILLLFALMLFSQQLREAGFYDAVGGRLIRGTDRPKRLLVAVIVVSAVLSALLCNDIVCLAFAPVLCAALLHAKRNPIPYLLALAFASNIGSAATIIGNPQNIYIGEACRLRFGHFTLVMFVPVVFGLILSGIIIVAIWRRDFFGEQYRTQTHEHLATLEKPRTLDRAVIGKTLALLAVLVVSFLFLSSTARVVAALVGGGLLLISRNRASASMYKHVDWNLLLLFIGLFVVNGAMQPSGQTEWIMQSLRNTGIKLDNLPVLATATTALSNLVSNVPAVLLLRPSIPQQNHAAWYLLALVSTLAGNLTLVGSIANLIVAEQAARYRVKVDLGSYCLAGIPLTILTVVAGTTWIVWIMR